MEKILIVDGHNLLFRMFYGFQRPIYNSEGKDIRAVVGFTNAIISQLNSFKPDKLFVAFDSETSTEERLELFGDYKQNRIDYSQVPDEENPFVQLPMIYEAIDYMGIAYEVIRTCEADDYIATLAKAYGIDHQVMILSTDRDFLQLVNENTFVYSPRGKNSILFDEAKVVEKFSVRPDQIIDYKTLVGDSSDNIPGVKGIGPKTAVKILKFGTIEEILEGTTELDQKTFDKLKTFEEDIHMMKRLVTMKLDVPLLNNDLTVPSIHKTSRQILLECGVY